MPLNDKGYELPLDLNLTQLVEHEKLVRRRIHLRIEFEHITRLWHWRLGVSTCSFVLVSEVEFVIDGEPKILYEGVYQRDEVVVLMWFVKLGLGHNRCCMVHYFKFRLIAKRNYSRALSVVSWNSYK